MNGATALVSMLCGYGVDVIFGVPGDTNVALYEALRTVKDAPRHILCRDERSAVFMADCYARLSGKPGVAEVPSGAGALYGLPGVAEANKSSVPLILLVNDIPQPGVGRGTLTELPIEELFKPLCKRAETLGHVGKLPEVVRRAFREATGGRPGAVVLALPEDLLYQDMPGEAVSLHVELQCRQAPSYRSRPPDCDLDAAIDAILTAERPLIVAGGGANRSGAAASITALAERLDIPVVTTITGQGVIRDDHKLGIGIIGDNGCLPMPCNVVSDAGTPTPYATRFLRLRDPQSRLVIPRFYGGLGYAIPAVVGAYFAAPHLRPVGLFGDGSLGMSAGELETLSRLQIPAVLIHFNNACFGWIKALQRVVDRDHARKPSVRGSRD